MDSLFEILKLILPASIVFLTSFYIIKNFLDSEAKKRVLDVKISNREFITPVRLQAYERLALFLERISPNSLVMRIHKNGMSARLLQTELLKTIRAEFEHNLSQQIYISNKGWEMVKNAKEEMIRLVNLSSARVSDAASGTELSQVIIDLASKIDKLAPQVALEYLKKEIAQTF